MYNLVHVIFKFPHQNLRRFRKPGKSFPPKTREKEKGQNFSPVVAIEVGFFSKGWERGHRGAGDACELEPPPKFHSLPLNESCFQTVPRLEVILFDCLSRWWFQTFFISSPRKLVKMNPFWLIFFGWVETNNQFHSLPLKKWMVGRRSFPFGRAYFQGQRVLNFQWVPFFWVVKG